MRTYEIIDQIIKEKMVEAIKAAGPAGVSEAKMREIEFNTMDAALKRLCILWDDLVATIERGEVA